jgi:tripartite-type tricarboxylate transporter receptor subunit TctC
MIGSSAGLPFVEQGKLRALVAFLPKRSELAPDVPLLSEVGMRSLELEQWGAIVGPKGMPVDATEKLGKAFIAAAGLPDVKAAADKWGFTLMPQGPEELRSVIATQLEAHRRVVKDSAIPLK